MENRIAAKVLRQDEDITYSTSSLREARAIGAEAIELLEWMRENCCDLIHDVDGWVVATENCCSLTEDAYKSPLEAIRAAKAAGTNLVQTPENLS